MDRSGWRARWVAEIGLASIFGGLACCATPEGQSPGSCADGADNDANGLFDCDDPGCWGSPDCGSAAAGHDSGSTADFGECTESVPVYACFPSGTATYCREFVGSYYTREGVDDCLDMLDFCPPEHIVDGRTYYRQDQCCENQEEGQEMERNLYYYIESYCP